MDYGPRRYYGGAFFYNRGGNVTRTIQYTYTTGEPDKVQ